MSGRKIFNFNMGWFALLIVLACAHFALAGGFNISVEAPKANSTDASMKDAVVMVVTPHGCHQPSDASLKAVAEGLVNGKRQSVPLQLTLTDGGGYAIKRQWPAREGVWVVAITGTYRGLTSSALVELAPRGGRAAHSSLGDRSDELAARVVPRTLNDKEINDSLQSLASNAARNLQAARSVN